MPSLSFGTPNVDRYVNHFVRKVPTAKIVFHRKSLGAMSSVLDQLTLRC